MAAEAERERMGLRLKEAREYLGFSQEEVASAVGLARSALSLIESGRRRVEALELKKLANVYGYPITYFTEEERPTRPVEADLQHLARKVAELSEDDREELARFADYLRTRQHEQDD